MHPQSSQRFKANGFPEDNDRAEIGPTALAFSEWAEAGLELPHIPTLREHRLTRLLKLLHERDYGGLLLFDPLNIRYASDVASMQVWALHNPFRACFVGADGYIVVWDYVRMDNRLLCFNPLIREIRGSASFFYFDKGDKTAENAALFAGEIDSLMREHCGTNRRLAVDKIMVHGLHALEKLGMQVLEGEELTEKARAIKGPDEIKAIRCALFSCERAFSEMERLCEPGVTEVDIWSALHAENIRRGGEWIETRLLSTGPRTNPWFQECGPRVVQDGDILCVDSDLIGPYGMCADISRAWLIGDSHPTEEQKRLFNVAHEHITTNMELFKPGATFRELTFGAHQLPEEFCHQRYGCIMHGVGLCDEWPRILYPQDWHPGAFDYVLEPGMVMTSEAYVGAVNGREGVKLEDQVVITEEGYENITRYPFDPRLLG